MLKPSFVFKVVFSLVAIFSGAAKGDRYCGIYAVFGSAQVLGVEADFDSLVDPEFVPSWKGSNVSNLMAAGEEVGINLSPLWHLGRSSLVSSKDPLILHFCSYGQLNKYDHWVLFLGMKGEQALIVDGGELIPMELSDVLLRWDGVALAAHLEDSPKTNYSQKETKDLLVWIVLVGTIMFTFRQFGSKSAFFPLVCFVTYLLLWLFLTKENFFFHSESLLYAERCHGPSSFEVVDTIELREKILKRQSDLVLIDARFPNDFSHGTILGAINLPVNSSINDVRRAVGHLDKSSEVVVFCLSDKCEFDREIAIKISGEGFKKIHLYEKGWYGWIGQDSDR